MRGRVHPLTTAAPPQPSKQELERAEAQTMTDIKWTAASAVVLYLCMLSSLRLIRCRNANEIAAPFLVDYVYKLI